MLFCASAGAAAFALRQSGLRALGQRVAWAPALATILLTAAYLAPVLGAAGPSINVRLGGMPADNILPGLLAHRVVTHASTRRPVPPLGSGERASERPPLQAAIVVGIGMPRGRLATVLVACACSGFLFLNTVFTWPKLLAAALMLSALAVMLEEVDAATARPRTIVAAAFATLALLAHPAPIFTLVVVPLVWPWLRSLVALRPSATGLFAGACLAVALVAPWLFYVTAVDPADGRLVREHLSDGRRTGSIGADVVRAHLERPLAEHVRVRLGNLAAQMGDVRRALSPFDVAAARQEQFFRHGAALGVLLVGLVAACLRAPRGTPDDAVRRPALVAGRRSRSGPC